MASVESTAPTSTAGIKSTACPWRWACCTTVQFTAAATGTHRATRVPTSGTSRTWVPYIQAMPSPATMMATQVRGAMRCPIKTRATSAVSKGPEAMVTSTLETGISVIPTMKAVNITLQHRPEIHSAEPPRRNGTKALRPCNAGSRTSRETSVNTLRQKVTSKLRAMLQLARQPPQRSTT